MLKKINNKTREKLLNKVIGGKVKQQINIDSPIPDEEDGELTLYIDEKGQFYINFVYNEILVFSTEGQTVGKIRV